MRGLSAPVLLRAHTIHFFEFPIKEVHIRIPAELCDHRSILQYPGRFPDWDWRKRAAGYQCRIYHQGPDQRRAVTTVWPRSRQRLRSMQLSLHSATEASSGIIRFPIGCCTTKRYSGFFRFTESPFRKACSDKRESLSMLCLDAAYFFSV